MRHTRRTLRKTPKGRHSRSAINDSVKLPPETKSPGVATLIEYARTPKHTQSHMQHTHTHTHDAHANGLMACVATICFSINHRINPRTTRRTDRCWRTGSGRNRCVGCLCVRVCVCIRPERDPYFMPAMVNAGHVRFIAYNLYTRDSPDHRSRYLIGLEDDIFPTALRPNRWPDGAMSTGLDRHNIINLNRAK